jgi:hypothetical protein
MKEFHIQHNIGKAKYVVNYHDGEKKHNDGSDFFDIAIFRSKKDMSSFTTQLRREGYSER